MNLSSVNFNQLAGNVTPPKGLNTDADIQALKKKLQELQDQRKEAIQHKDVKEKQKLEKKIAQIKKQIEQLRKQKEKEQEKDVDKTKKQREPAANQNLQQTSFDVYA